MFTRGYLPVVEVPERKSGTEELCYLYKGVHLFPLKKKRKRKRKKLALLLRTASTLVSAVTICALRKRRARAVLTVLTR